MNHNFRSIRSLSVKRSSRRGQTLVEYALLLAFVAVVAIAVLMNTGNTVRSTYNTVNTQLSIAQQGGIIVAPPSGGPSH